MSLSPCTDFYFKLIEHLSEIFRKISFKPPTHKYLNFSFKNSIKSISEVATVHILNDWLQASSGLWIMTENKASLKSDYEQSN